MPSDLYLFLKGQALKVSTNWQSLMKLSKMINKLTYDRYDPEEFLILAFL